LGLRIHYHKEAKASVYDSSTTHRVEGPDLIGARMSENTISTFSTIVMNKVT